MTPFLKGRGDSRYALLQRKRATGARAFISLTGQLVGLGTHSPSSVSDRFGLESLGLGPLDPGRWKVWGPFFWPIHSGVERDANRQTRKWRG